MSLVVIIPHDVGMFVVGAGSGVILSKLVRTVMRMSISQSQIDAVKIVGLVMFAAGTFATMSAGMNIAMWRYFIPHRTVATAECTGAAYM